MYLLKWTIKLFNYLIFKDRSDSFGCFSTWCPSCGAGLQALAQKQSKLMKNGVQIIALRNYNHGGYISSSGNVKKFIKKSLKSPKILMKAKNWTFGVASKALESKYNPRHHSDIFFLD